MIFPSFLRLPPNYQDLHSWNQEQDTYQFVTPHPLSNKSLFLCKSLSCVTSQTIHSQFLINALNIIHTNECRVSQNEAAQEWPAVGKGDEWPRAHVRLQSWDQGNLDICHGNQDQRCICFQSFIIPLTFLSLFFLSLLKNSLKRCNCTIYFI